VSEWERLAKLRQKCKFIWLKEEINGIIEEILEEEESDIKDINNLMYTAGTTMTQALNELSKRNKNRRNENFGK